MSVSKKMLTLLGESFSAPPEQVRKDYIEAAELALSMRAKEKAAAEKALKAVLQLRDALEAIAEVYLKKDSDSFNDDMNRLDELDGALSDYQEEYDPASDDRIVGDAIDAYHVNFAFGEFSRNGEDFLKDIKELGRLETGLTHIKNDLRNYSRYVDLKRDLEKVKKSK